MITYKQNNTIYGEFSITGPSGPTNADSAPIVNFYAGGTEIIVSGSVSVSNYATGAYSATGTAPDLSNYKGLPIRMKVVVVIGGVTFTITKTVGVAITNNADILYWRGNQPANVSEGYMLARNEGDDAIATGQAVDTINTTLAAAKTILDRLNTMLEDDGTETSKYQLTTKSVENAPTGGSTGSGAISYTHIVTDGTSPLDGVLVWLTTDEAGETTPVVSGHTNASGEVTFYLDAGTYYIWKQLAGYNFTNPESVTVS